MRTPREIDLKALGRNGELPNRPDSLGRTVRFLNPTPLDGCAVYTLDPRPHHYLKQGQLAKVVEITPDGLLTLRLKYRERLVTGVPIALVEPMPEPLVIVGPLTEDNVTVLGDVEFAFECPVDGGCRHVKTGIPHHVIMPGTKGVVLRWEYKHADVRIQGRERPILKVPFELLDCMGEKKSEGIS